MPGSSINPTTNGRLTQAGNCLRILVQFQLYTAIGCVKVKVFSFKLWWCFNYVLLISELVSSASDKFLVIPSYVPSFGEKDESKQEWVL